MILRSDLGTFQIAGPDVRAFLTRMVPLLDGSRDEPAIIEALADYSSESVTTFLGLLRQRGLIELSTADAPRPSGPDAFFRSWDLAPEEAKKRQKEARVLLAGAQPWGAVAATELVAAGLGALHVIDDTVGLEDEALIAAGPWTLLLSAVPPDDAAQVERISRLAHRAGVVSLWAHVDGTALVLGPLVTPGETACRVCSAAEGLNPLAARSPATTPASSLGAAWTAATQKLLGHMVAMEALVHITMYTRSELGGRLLVEDHRTLETSRHALVRLPWCPVCGDGQSGPRFGSTL